MATSVELNFLEKQFPSDFIRDRVTTYENRQRRVVQLERIQFGNDLKPSERARFKFRKGGSLLATKSFQGI